MEAQLSDRNVTIDLTEAARKHLAEAGYDVTMGARPLARVIQEKIKRPLAEEILFGKLEKGGLVVVDFDGSELAFSYEDGKPPRRNKKKSAEKEKVRK